jgi:hypothetical protein
MNLVSREGSRPGMHLRVCIAALAAMFGLLLGPAVAQANHSFSISKTQAAAGDEVEFQITSTQAGESYIVKVDDQEVASGVDSTGNGVSDKFKMPDLGSSDMAVSVEVRITPLNGDPDHFGPATIQYLAATSGASSGPPVLQPAPVPIATTPNPEPTPVISTPSKPKPKPKNTHENNLPKNTDNPTAHPKTSDQPTTTTTSTPTSTGSGSSSPSVNTSNQPSSTGAVAPTSSPPPGPTGPNAPVGTSTATALSPVSGLVEAGKTGFPVLVILLIVLLAATALTAAGPRLWQRWEPALPWGPSVDDDVRLTALRRASASGAELQQTIAARKVTRSVGRTG